MVAPYGISVPLIFISFNWTTSSTLLSSNGRFDMDRIGSVNEMVIDLFLGTLMLLSDGSKITDGEFVSRVVKVALCGDKALFKESSNPAAIAT